MLRSPLGCGFLLAAAASGLPPNKIVSPHVSLYLCAYASSDIEVWQSDYHRIRAEILRQGQQRRDLALMVLQEPAAAHWFGPLDTRRQVCVPRERQAPHPARFVPPASPLSSWERYAEKSSGGLLTSTLVDETASIFVAQDERICDFDLRESQRPNYTSWLLKADPSARVLEVDGAQAWHDLCVRYPAPGSIHSTTPDFTADEGRLVPDWPAVAADWDAVHFTFGGLLTADQVRVESAAGWTYHWSWNIEQTLWLRWVFTGVEQLPDHVPQVSPLVGLFHPMFRARAKLY